ncbi:Protein kinase-like protein [Melia azedarach]|uniref:Protein kinase-like protein n=1 Tax=Melia azedarach TaxID=155640 RepID=A0ACC1XVW7_MELAZ|nr:Protein kinase-like protein [Melia azedarach]
MEWVRGDVLGHGSFGSVHLAIPRKFSSQFPSLMAVKSSADGYSITLKNEKEILDKVGFCPQIVRCFGDDYSVENGDRVYNLLLEYASKGSLADQVKKNNGHLQESDVRRYTRSLIKGLQHIHAKGFVHCDIKLQNVLVFDEDEVKIADFGLAKKSGDEQSRCECRGTPLYMSPESVNDNEYESPCDIWALGCAVVEMMTGKPAWNHKQESNLFNLLIRIGVGDELPIIPGELSEEGKDFLMKCFVKDPKKRWTAEMLLNHPFVCVADGGDGNEFVRKKGSEEISTSPRSPFSFPEWKSVQSSATTSISENSKFDSLLTSGDCLMDRIRLLACDEKPSWSDSESWISVR